MILHMVGSSLWFCVGAAPKGPVCPHLQLAWTLSHLILEEDQARKGMRARGRCGQEAFPLSGLLMKAGEGPPGSTRLSFPHFPSPVPSRPPRATLLHVPLGATCYCSGLRSNATTSERASLTTSGQEPPRLVTRLFVPSTDHCVEDAEEGLC